MTIKPSTRASIELVLGFLALAGAGYFVVWLFVKAVTAFFGFWGMI